MIKCNIDVYGLNLKMENTMYIFYLPRDITNWQLKPKYGGCNLPIEVVAFNMVVLTLYFSYKNVFSGCNLRMAVVTFNMAVVTK